MGKGKLLLLIFAIVIVAGILLFYMGEKNKQGKHLSAEKTEAVKKAKGREKTAGKKDSAAAQMHEPVFVRKQISSHSKGQGITGEHEFDSETTFEDVREHEAKEREYELNKDFEEEAKEVLPLLSIQTNNPLDTKAFGPRRGEIWVRVKPDNAKELKEIMEDLADLYRADTGYRGSLTIMHWVGGRPHLKMTFPANGENEQR